MDVGKFITLSIDVLDAENTLSPSENWDIGDGHFACFCRGAGDENYLFQADIPVNKLFPFTCDGSMGFIFTFLVKGVSVIGKSISRLAFTLAICNAPASQVVKTRGQWQIACGEYLMNSNDRTSEVFLVLNDKKQIKAVQWMVKKTDFNEMVENIKMSEHIPKMNFEIKKGEDILNTSQESVAESNGGRQRKKRKAGKSA